MSGEPLLDEERAVGDDAGWLPLWAIDDQILAYARSRKENPGNTPASFLKGSHYERVRGDKLLPSEIAGPALPWVYMSTFLLWSFFLTFPAVVWLQSSCKSQDISDSLESSHIWLYCLFVPVVVAAMWMEWKCLRIVILSQVQWTGPYSVWGITPSYTAWLFAMALYSMLSHADVVTQNVVVVSLLKQLWGCDRQTIYDMWLHVQQQAKIFQFHFPLPGLGVLAAITWLLMPLQFVWAVFFATPAQKIDYGIGITDTQRKGFQTIATQLFGESCWDRRWSNDTLDCYVTVNRMVSVSFQSKYQTIQSAQWFLTAEFRTHELVHATKEFFWRLVPLLETEVPRFLFSSLQTLAKLELQVTILALDRALTGSGQKPVNWSIQLPVAISILTASLSLTQAAGLCLRIRSEGNSAMMLVQSDPRWRAHSCLVTKFKIYLTLFAVLMAVYATVVLHSCIKLVQAYHCHDSLWNLSGCVHLSQR